MDATSEKKCYVICPMIICPSFACCIIPFTYYAVNNNDKVQAWLLDDSMKTCQRCRCVRKATEEDFENYMENHESMFLYVGKKFAN